MSLYRDEAVVLRTWKLGEADRIISLHTLSHGKVRCVAKGVRRTRSKFGARLESACHVAVQLYRGRSELQTVTQAETLDRFASLRAQPERFARASAMLEAVDQLAQEGEADSERHLLLVRALRELDARGGPLVMAAFLLKLLALNGVCPQLDLCVACGETAALEAISVAQGGVLCRACRQGRPISGEALTLMRWMLGGRLREALGSKASDAHAEVCDIAATAMEAHLERRLRSVAVLGRA